MFRLLLMYLTSGLNCVQIQLELTVVIDSTMSLNLLVETHSRQGGTLHPNEFQSKFEPYYKLFHYTYFHI